MTLDMSFPIGPSGKTKAKSMTFIVVSISILYREALVSVIQDGLHMVLLQKLTHILTLIVIIALQLCIMELSKIIKNYVNSFFLMVTTSGLKLIQR